MVELAPIQRHLAAILAADVAGYSRLMGADEEGTLARLKALRAELVDPAIAVHRGRIVKTTGDGLLVEFASVVDALRCAIAWQTAMTERDEKRIQFRIGINLGDIISDSGDIFGDGVNIAARLEGMAEPGGICIDSVVLAQTRGKLEFPADDLGEQTLKNIAHPVHVYRVGLLASRLGARESAAPPSGPPALPEKPSLAVLPFQNMSGDPEQEYFSDGMVEDITTAIARVPWLFVVARNSAFAYKGKSPDLRQVGRELGVRYVLEGSVRKAGNRVRITGQLIDTTTGGHLWADRIDGGLDDIFDLQDRVASSVVGAIEPRLRLAEIERAARKAPQSLDAHDLYWRALAQFHKSTADSFQAAIRLLREALVIDPSYASALALLGQCRTWQRANGWEPVPLEAAAEAVAFAKQAADAGRDDPDALWMAGWTISYLSGDHQSGLGLIARALTLNANSALAWCAHGIVLAYANLPEPAIESLNQAMRLSPLDPLGYLFKAGFTLAHMLAGRYDEALKWVDETLREKPGLSSALRWKTSIYGHLGRTEEARALVQELLAQRPGLTVKRFDRYRENALEITTIFMDGLRKAGLPEE